MKKRNLFNIVLLIAVTGTLSALLLSLTPPKQKNIGLQLYSIRDSITKNVPAAIEKVAKMGYTFVEPAGYGNGKFYGIDPVEFKNLCVKNGIYVLSSHTGQSIPRDGNMEKGIKCAYHNPSGEFTTEFEGEPLYDFMLKNTDPSKVFFQLDLYWCVEGKNNPVDYFNKYPGRFILWHIKDKEEIGASGMMDFASIWAAQKKSGMKYGIVEVERYNFDQFTRCQKSIEFLNAAPYVKMPKK